MMNRLIITFFLAIGFASCKTSPKETVETETIETIQAVVIPETFAQKVESAHKKEAFLGYEAIQFDLALDFGGKPRMHGKFTVLTNSNSARIDLSDGSTLLYVQDKSYYSPNFSKPEKSRFDAYTWPYFFLFPYKLSDAGTVWSNFNQKNLNGKTYLTHHLSFEANIGDDPEDWYKVYADENTKLINTAAYIVTAGKTKEKAEESPSAIQYLDYELVNDIPIATTWKFWKWNEQDGLTKSKGEGKVTNVKFVELEEDFFEPSPEFIEK